MPSFASLAVPSFYVQTSRTYAPLSMAALRQAQRHAQHSTKAAAPATPKSDVVTFEEIKSLIQQKEKNVVLIDVREPSETAQGVIPGAHLIPLNTIPQALALSDKEFEERYGFKKIGRDDEVILYCRSGKRSTMAFELAKQLGYKGVRNYSGSWLDYEAKAKAQK